MAQASKWGKSSLVLGIAVALVVWVLEQAGWLAGWDDMFYDRLQLLTARWREPKAGLTLVRITRQHEFNDEEAIKTIETLATLGAKGVVFNFVPTRTSREFFQRAADLRRVVFGRALQPAPDNPDVLQLEPWPAAAQDADLQWGVVCLVPSRKGVYRWHQTDVTVGTNSYPTLERRAAAMFGPIAAWRSVSGKYLIDFAGAPGSFPNIHLSRVLAGDLIPEMVKDRIVLVGWDDGLLGVQTPMSLGGEPMSLLEFQANALQTLIEGHPIRVVRGVHALVLLVVLGIVSAFLYQRVSSVTGARVAAGMLVLCGLGGAVGLGYFGVWLQVGGLVVAQAAQFGLTLLVKSRMTQLALNEMRLRALNEIEERLGTQRSRLTSEFFDYVSDVLGRTLDAEQMVLFERIAGKKRLRELRAFNCGFEDVQERNRSLDAPLFARAVTNGRPMRVSGFFKPRQPQMDEYLCPLIFAGEVVGMLAVGINPARAASIRNFNGVLMKVSEEVARLLYQAKRAGPVMSFFGRLKAWFSANREDPIYQELRSTADALEKYHDVLDTVFSQISTATVVYDFFGCVLKANEPAIALMREENFAVTRGTAYDFLRLVTCKDDAQVRNLMRIVLFEGAPVSMSVTLPMQADKQFLLRLYPLKERKRTRLGPEVLSIQGLVCELVETTSLTTLSSLKGVVADRLGVDMRNHLAAIKISASLLEEDSVTPDERKSLLEGIQRKADICVGVLRECQKYLGQNVDAEALRCFPVEALQLLQQACNEFAQKAAERRVTFKVERPQILVHVMASPQQLAKVFSAILKLLLNDAAENTTLAIEVEDTLTTAQFRFSNSGFGIPNERLQEILASTDLPASEEFQVLREAAAWVRSWGGTFEVLSDVGKGYVVSMRLRQFQTDPSLALSAA
ncbi:MAG: CHASE2 domain-containing protein [Verrucomicrobiae bacterium]|nr:CHASE2 domain-containing protein [Verrucomicrobiae bacterium]